MSDNTPCEDCENITPKIEKLANDFDWMEERCTSDRISVLTKLEVVKNFIQNKVKVYDNLEEYDGDGMKQYAEANALFHLFEDIYNDVLRLDNDRCACAAKLCYMLNESNFYDVLPDSIHNYEY